MFFCSYETFFCHNSHTSAIPVQESTRSGTGLDDTAGNTHQARLFANGVF